MKRPLSLLALLALWPAGAAAQFRPQAPARLEVTPFVGVRFPQALVETRSGTTYDFTNTRRTAPVVGMEARLALWGAWGILGGAAYAFRTDELTDIQSSGGVDVYSKTYGSMLFARGDLQYKFPDPDPDNDDRLHRASLYIMAGPAFILAMPPSDPGSPSYLTDTYTQIAAHAGLRATGDVPFWPRVGFEIVGEDFVIVTNKNVYEDRLAQFFATNGGSGNAITGHDRNIFGIRFGLTWHL